MHRFLVAICLLATCALLPAQDLAAAPYLGEWINKDLHTRGITRISVKMASTGIMTQVWGKCSPADCDWGLVRATPKDPDADGPKLEMIWEHGFKAVIQTLHIDNDGQLHLSSVTHYTDNSGRKDRVESETFTRAPKAGN
jgi:hypothetical protein